MELKLFRKYPGADCVIGELFVNGTFECYTLEDVERKKKIKKLTSIPRGKYEVIISFSNRFRVLMPLVLNVPDFEGIRIHHGNTSANTDGCILVGRKKGIDRIDKSKLAYNALFPKLEVAVKTEKIFLEIAGA